MLSNRWYWITAKGCSNWHSRRILEYEFYKSQPAAPPLSVLPVLHRRHAGGFPESL